MSKIWRLEDIDPDDPEERFLPVLQAIPYGANAVPMVFPENIARAISRHMTEAGCPPIDPTIATKKLQLPHRGPNTGYNPAIQWVDIDTDAPPPVVIQDPAAMTVHERAAVVERLRYQGYRINEPEPQTPTAEVVDTLDEPPRYDPGAHSVTEVLAYLRSLDDGDIERARVIHAERTGQARKGILKRHGGA